MHVRLTPLPDAVCSPPADAPGATPLRRLLLELLAKHGRLVFASTEAHDQFFAALRRSGSQASRIEWQAVYIALRKADRMRVLDAAAPAAPPSTLSALAQSLDGNSDVVLLGDSDALALGMSATPGYLAGQGSLPEVATVAGIWESMRVEALRACQAGGNVARGASRQSFWNEVLEPISEGARRAIVVDRFLLSRAERALSMGKRVTHGDVGHVTWLLQQLDESMALGSDIELRCARDPKRSFVSDALLVDALRRLCAPAALGRLAEVRVLLNHPPVLAHFPHDRHIRFSNGAAVSLPAGFDRLIKATVEDSDGMAWNYFGDASNLQRMMLIEKHAKAGVAMTHTLFHR